MTETQDAQSPNDIGIRDASDGFDTMRLYSAMADDYDESFARIAHRHAYDRLAGELIDRYLPQSGASILDVGCGTGRWAERWLARGHRVSGIEAAPGMLRVLAGRNLGPRFSLIESPMETADIAPGSMDLVVAMGSVQYAANPSDMIRRFAGWVRPGGLVCVYVDSLVALVLELIRLGRQEEALERLRTRRGVFTIGDTRAGLHLYDRATLITDFEGAGLVDIDCRGLLISNAALGSTGCAQALAEDKETFLAFERHLATAPLMADVGRHLFAVGGRPV